MSFDPNVDQTRAEQTKRFGFTLVEMDRSRLLQTLAKMQKLWEHLSDCDNWYLPEPVKHQLEAEIKSLEKKVAEAGELLKIAIEDTDKASERTFKVFAENRILL